MAEVVNILAMGPTWGACPDEKADGEEIWGVNTTYRYGKPLDRLFCMHDLRQEVLLQRKDFLDEVNETGLPFYTAGTYPELENNVDYPLKDIFTEFNAIFFLNTMSYMLALAIYEMAPWSDRANWGERDKTIKLYGVDMRPDSGMEHHQNEKGCVEFWLGVAIARGINVRVPEESYLLRRTMTGNFYGYKQRPAADGLVSLTPENSDRKRLRYKLTPIDMDGTEYEDEAVYSNVRQTGVAGMDIHTQQGYKSGQEAV